MFSFLHPTELLTSNGLSKFSWSILIISGSARKISKYRVFSGPYFPALELNTKMYSVNLRIQSEYRKIRTRKNNLNTGKYGPERTVYLDTFHAVTVLWYAKVKNRMQCAVTTSHLLSLSFGKYILNMRSM